MEKLHNESQFTEYLQRDGESFFDWKLRLIISKIEKTLDLDWSEIRDILGLDISSDHLRKTGYGIYEYHKYFNNKDNHSINKTRILSISDTHVPYQLPITIFEKYIGAVDILQLNGDILDCQSISKFPKTYRVSMIEEMIKARQYVIDLIDYIKPKKVIANYGNHELRFRDYLSKNLDNDMSHLMPETALDLIFDDGFHHYDKRNKTKTWYEPLTKVFNNVEIEYTGSWWNQIGQTIFCHPLTYSSAMLNTAKKAMTWFRNEGYSHKAIVVAHTHRVGNYKIGNTTIYEQGTCSDTKQQDYVNGKLVDSQKEGFIYLIQDSNGEIIKEEQVDIN